MIKSESYFKKIALSQPRPKRGDLSEISIENSNSIVQISATATNVNKGFLSFAIKK